MPDCRWSNAKTKMLPTHNNPQIRGNLLDRNKPICFFDDNLGWPANGPNIPFSALQQRLRPTFSQHQTTPVASKSEENRFWAESMYLLEGLLVRAARPKGMRKCRPESSDDDQDLPQHQAAHKHFVQQSEVAPPYILHCYLPQRPTRGPSRKKKNEKNLWSPGINVQRQSLQGAKRLDEGAPEKYGKETSSTGL